MDQYDHTEFFCTTVVPVPKAHLGGASLKYFYIIQRKQKGDMRVVVFVLFLFC